MKFEDALAMRLGAMQPSTADLLAYLEAHPPRISPGATLICTRPHPVHITPSGHGASGLQAPCKRCRQFDLWMPFVFLPM